MEFYVTTNQYCNKIIFEIHAFLLSHEEFFKKYKRHCEIYEGTKPINDCMKTCILYRLKQVFKFTSYIFQKVHIHHQTVLTILATAHKNVILRKRQAT